MNKGKEKNSAHLQREKFSDQDPRSRTPGRGETGNEEESEDDEDGLACGRSWSGDSGNTDGQLTQTHENSSVEEEFSSTELLDHVDTGETANRRLARSIPGEGRYSRHADVNDTSSDSDEVGRVDLSTANANKSVFDLAKLEICRRGKEKLENV